MSSWIPYSPDMLRSRVGLQGATGEVFARAGSPDQVVKRFYEASYEPHGNSHVERLILWRTELSVEDRLFLDQQFAWPREPVIDAGTVIGFTMPKAPAHFWVSALGTKRLRTLGHLRSPDALVGTHDVADSVVLRTRSQFSGALQFLTLRGASYRDISDQNILWAARAPGTGLPALYFLDCDSCRLTSSEPAVSIHGSRGWTGDSPTGANDTFAVAAFHVRVRRHFVGDLRSFRAAESLPCVNSDRLSENILGKSKAEPIEVLRSALAVEFCREAADTERQSGISIGSATVVTVIVAILVVLIMAVA